MDDIGFAVGHYAGSFPLWLAPDQVRVITLNADEMLIDYVRPIVNELRANMVRADSDFGATSFKTEISDAEQVEMFLASRRQLMLAIGDLDMNASTVNIRPYHGGPQGANPDRS